MKNVTVSLSALMLAAGLLAGCGEKAENAATPSQTTEKAAQDAAAATEKAADAKKLGAHNVIISKDTKQMEKAAGTFDYILNTIPSPHNVDPYSPCPPSLYP